MAKSKKENASVRIRKAEFSGAEDKFYAPGDDIRNCCISLIRGGLEAATARFPELQEELGKCAIVLARYYQEAFLAEDKIPALMHKLNEDLKAISPTASEACLAEVARSMLTYYGIAQRETSGHKDLTKPQVEKIAAVGTLMGHFDEEDRRSFTKLLANNRIYPEELDREPMEGVIIENEDRKDTEEAK